jgi:uncharacterized membrane protein
MSRNIRKIAFGGLAAAIVFVVTRFVAIPVSAVSGAYINCGDSAIYFIAYLLGGPAAAVSSAVGSALSDVLTPNAVIYAPATLVIKGLMGLTAGVLMKRRRFGFYAAACVIGGAIMTLGYGVYESFLYGVPVALADALMNLIQWGGSVAIALVLYPVAARIEKVMRFETQH